MNSKELIAGVENGIKSKSTLLFTAAGALLAGLALYMFKDESEEPVETDPPPIIIKSGSFIVEAREVLNESGGTGGKPFVYKSSTGFNLKWARILVYNEITGNIRPFEFFENPTVSIWFKPLSIPGAVPDVVIRQNGSDFELSIKTKKKLKFKTSSHSSRKNKYEDDEHPDTINFSRVEINGSRYDSTKGDQFVIGFFES